MRRLWAGALILTGVVAIAVGIFRGPRHHREHRERFEEHVADLCVDAALRTRADDRFDRPHRFRRHDRGPAPDVAPPPPADAP